MTDEMPISTRIVAILAPPTTSTSLGYGMIHRGAPTETDRITSWLSHYWKQAQAEQDTCFRTASIAILLPYSRRFYATFRAKLCRNGQDGTGASHLWNKGTTPCKETSLPPGD